MDRKAQFEDVAAWNTEFSERLTAYQNLIDTHREREAKFQAEKQVALEELRRTWMLEREEPEKHLLAIAPILAGDVDALPTFRAAYSDRTAAMMAKIAMLAYIGFEDADKKKILDGILTHGRVKLLETITARETEALVAETDKFVVVAFRGSTSRRDTRTDLRTRFNVSKIDLEGRVVSVSVHSGFYNAFAKVEGQVRDLLNKTKNKPIYLTGHSLGGALALVASAALGISEEFGDRIAAVYTFGAPRVAQGNFSDVIKAPHYRVVNSGDIVPLVPPSWLRGYRHTGMPVLLKKDASKPIRRSPRGSAFLHTVLSLVLWPFTRQMRFRAAHDSLLYVTNLERMARNRGRWT
jgi:triacylglycerol lipase